MDLFLDLWHKVMVAASCWCPEITFRRNHAASLKSINRPEKSQMRHTLEIKTVKALRNPKAPASIIRAQFCKKMAAWGYGCMDTDRAWRDCIDMAELENLAE